MSTCNINQAAELLCIHPRTALDLIASGAIPAAKVGRAWVMKTQDILDFLDAQIAFQTRQRMTSPHTVSKVRRNNTK